MLIQIIPFSYPLTEKVKDEIQKFASELHPENSRCVFSAAQHENTKLPEIPGGEQTCWLCNDIYAGNRSSR